MVVINMDATGKNIRARIKESGFKMKDIAEQVSVHPQAVYKWSYGTSLPSIDNFVILADMLETTIDDLLVKERI